MSAQVFRLPDLGEGLTEAGLVQWLVAVGDEIAIDQPIAEVETAKSTVELPSPYGGIVAALHGTPGESLLVGSPVLEVASRDTPSVEHETYRAEERAGSGNVLVGYGTSERAGSGRRRPRTGAPSAAEQTPAAAPAEQTPAATAAEQTPAPAARVAVRSPLVRRLARDLGLDLSAIAPTGTDGAITRADVLRCAVDTAVDGITPSDPLTAAVDENPTGEVDGLRIRSREPLSALRRAASAQLSRSRSEIPEATVWVDVDATRLWELRAQLVPDGDRAPSLTTLIARFVLLALEEYPVLASRLEAGGTELVSFDGVNLGIAADTERGLVVPVIRDAGRKSLATLDCALRELAADARAGRIPPAHLRGSTFTLNNYGGFGVDGSAAIINQPDVAILGIGRMIERPWVVDGQIVPRRIAQLSLVFDHRVCDGGYAAGFLRRVTELIEHPVRGYGRV